jgi:hypothetical protein
MRQTERQGFFGPERERKKEVMNTGANGIRR